MRPHRLFAALLLSACAAAGPPPVPQGEVTVGVQRFPVEALGATTWRVRVDGRPVTCAKPTAESCYWAARHHLQMQELPDLPG